ncbi:MAG: hypothetical protein R3E89_15185 [Thiolinea sp.]
MERVEQQLLHMQGRLGGPLHVNMPMSYGKLRLGRFLAAFLYGPSDIRLTCHLDDAY